MPYPSILWIVEQNWGHSNPAERKEFNPFAGFMAKSAAELSLLAQKYRLER
jgi:hypothetical protein